MRLKRPGLCGDVRKGSSPDAGTVEAQSNSARIWG